MSRRATMRSCRRASIAALCACAAALVCTAAGARAATGTTVGGQHHGIDLSPRDLAIVRELACRSYAVAPETVGPAERWTYGGRYPPSIEVAVRCAPHATVNGLPSHYNVECRRDDDRRDRRWQCQGWEAILVPTQIGDIAVEPGPYSHDFATRTVHAALDSSRFQRQAHDALPSGCRLASNWDGTGDEVAELSCASGHRFLFSFWCPQNDCPRLMTATSPLE